MRRVPESIIAPTLTRMTDLVSLLGDPQHSAPAIHITGTNGKTSTSRMIESLLRAFGLRTGGYTSPHLITPRERILLEGEPIPEDRFVAGYEEIAPYLQLVDHRSAAAGGPPLSFFEAMTALAYVCFADAPVEVSVIEVGMGGRWDATNVVDGQVAVVTPISIDHVEYLGSDLAGIAAEKAGIIKPGSIAVLGQQELAAAEVLLREALRVEAIVAREGVEFGVIRRDVGVGGQLISLQGLGGNYEDIFLPLHGAHQAHNAVLALVAVESFLGGGRGVLDPDVVRAGFAQATSPGRLEVVRRSPTVLLDAAHNPAGALALAEAVADSFAFDRLIGVVAILADKDARGVLEALEPVLDQVVVTASSSPRALAVAALFELAGEVFGFDRVTQVPRLIDAIDVAVALAEEAGEVGGAGVLITGSVATAGEARALFSRNG
ncbi:MAG: folylpolyglutamate synthase/dihydrofolate synthase family protein [Actinomycetes bacterium]